MSRKMTITLGKRFCVLCQTDITHRREGVITCSEACRQRVRRQQLKRDRIEVFPEQSTCSEGTQIVHSDVPGHMGRPLENERVIPLFSPRCPICSTAWPHAGMAVCPSQECRYPTRWHRDKFGVVSP